MRRDWSNNWSWPIDLLLDCLTLLFFSGYLAFMMTSNSETLTISYREKRYSPRDTEIGY